MRQINRITGNILLPQWPDFCRWLIYALFILGLGCSAGTTLAGLWFLAHYAAAPTAAERDTAASVAKLRAENESLRLAVVDYVNKMNVKPGRAEVGIGGN